MRVYFDTGDNVVERIKQQVSDHIYRSLTKSKKPWPSLRLDHWKTVVIPEPVNIEFGPFPRR